MNRWMRTLVMAGLGLVAGATVATVPAAAATADAGSPRHDRVLGYFDSYRKCEWVGRRGEVRGGWEDHDCYRVRHGSHRGDWALWVDFGRDRDRRHGFPKR